MAAREDDLVREVVVDDDGVRMSLVGEIDAASAPALQQRLLEVIGTSAGAVALDMSGVSFVDSTGIRLLITVHRRLDEHHRSLVLSAISPQTRRVLDLAGLCSMFGTDDAS